ncbi:MAG: DinB family protein [Acidobacteriota bacterium]
MKQAIRSLMFAAAALALSGSTAFAQATLYGDVVKDWEGQKDLLVKLASAMPDDKLGFKPTPAQRSFGEHILHIAQVNVALLTAVGGKAPAPTIDMKATTKAAMIKQMTDSFDYGAALLKEFDNTTIQGTVTQPFGMGPATRARVFFFLVGHTQDTYGQMAVYLRLNGGVPPASQRP